MSTITITISGTTTSIDRDTLQIVSRVDDHDQCTFSLVDDTGTKVYQRGQPVTVVDSTLGTLFSGYISKPNMVNLYPNAANRWTVTCIDQFYLLAKNASKKRYKKLDSTGYKAGAIAADQIQRYLASDGVTGNFALRWDETQSDWSAGTLTNVTAATNLTSGNPSGGDLELALAGTSFVSSPASGTVSTAHAIAVSGYASSVVSNPSVVRQIWSGSQLIGAGLSNFSYDIWISSSSPLIVASCDFMCSDGTLLSAQSLVDNQGLTNAWTTDLSGLATDTWYTRPFFISALSGKTITSVNIVLAGKTAGTYKAYFKNIFYNDGTPGPGHTTNFFTTSLSANNQLSLFGYSNVSVAVATVSSTQSRQFIFVPGTYSGVTIVKSSQVSWTPTIPDGCTLLLESSIDNQATWQTLTSGSAIPNLLAGMETSNVNLTYRATLTLGDDPTQTTLGFTNFLTQIATAYAATKTDLEQGYGNATGATAFSAGTLTNTQVVSNQLTLTGSQESFAGTLPNIVPFGNGGTGSTTIVDQMLQFQYTSVGGAWTERLDFAGNTWQNFTAEVDVTIPTNASSTSAGMVYRTTGWQNNNNTFAYLAYANTTTLGLGRGTNSSTGTGTFTGIATATIAVTAGSVHRLKVVVSGSSHILFLDGVQLISATDATFSAAGYFGLRQFNASGSTLTTDFANFGVVNALTGTWQSAALSISSPTTYGNSVVAWDIDNLPDNTCSISMQSSVDGGSTFQSVTNGGAIPNLTAGQSLSSKTLILKATLSANTAPVVPVMNGVSVFVLGQYSSSGTRVSPSLALTRAGRALNSLVDYNANIPTNTSVTVQTSTDSGTTYQAASPQGGIPGIATLLYSTLILQKQPLGYYRLNETSGTAAKDSSTHANNGTLNGTITFNQSGALQGPGEITDPSMLFDGSTAYISLPTALNGNGFTSLSISFWFNLSTTTLSSFTNIATGDATGSNKGWQCFWSSNTTLEFGVGNGTTNATAMYAVNAVAGVWWHVVGVYDGSTVRMYVNGVQHGTTPALTGSISASAIPVISGTTTHSSLFPGRIDEVAIFQNVVLSASDVTALYNAGLSGVGQIIDDTFSSDTSANYTQTFGSGGSGATWTWETTNSRIKAVGGSKAQLLYKNLWATDISMFADFYQAQNSGLIWGWQDASNYYALVVDDSAGSTPNTLTLNKTSAGVTTQLATGAITFSSGTYHRVTMSMLAGVITVSFDETQILSYTDASPFANAGQAGLRNDTGTSYVYQIQITPQAPDISSKSVLTKHTLTSSDPTVTPQLLDAHTMASDGTFALGSIIQEAEYKQQHVSDNFDDLRTKSNYWYSISTAKNILFQSRTATNAPWILQNTDIQVSSPSVDYSGDLYRNRQTLEGVLETTTFTETKFGDGSTRTWNVAHPIIAIPTITLNNLPATVGVLNTDMNRQFYYQPGSLAITQDTGQTLLASTDSFVIVYSGTSTIDFTLDNTSIPGTVTQSAMAAIDGTSGIVEAIEDVSAQNMDTTTATTYATQLLTRYGTTGSTGRTPQFTTLHIGLSAGQNLSAFASQLLLVDATLLVVQVTISVRSIANSDGYMYVYDVTASESAALSSWIKFLNKIFRGML